MNLETAKADAEAIFSQVLSAMDPRRLVRESLTFDEHALTVGGQRYQIHPDGKIVLFGVGKSAVGMAGGVEDVLGDRLDHGFIVTKRGLGDRAASLRRTTVWEASHPVPDESSVSAGTELLRQGQQLGEHDLAIVVVSGGGSSLVEVPLEGIDLDDLKAMTNTLLNEGADISTLNAVRGRMSRLKAGGLARAIAPASVINLILSDVLGNPLNVIASGLSVPPDSDSGQFIRTLRTGKLWEALPERVRTRLTSDGVQSVSDITNVLQNLIIGDSSSVVRAASAAAARLGYKPYVLGSRFSGDAREFGHFWAQTALAAHCGISAIRPRACIIGSGEMTVQVHGKGLGGRNTEMVASAAFQIAGSDHVAIASLATDGDDGISGAAGGIVTGDTIANLIDLELEPERFLRQNATRDFLLRSGGLIVTGQTGVNVNDLYLALIA